MADDCGNSRSGMDAAADRMRDGILICISQVMLRFQARPHHEGLRHDSFGKCEVFLRRGAIYCAPTDRTFVGVALKVPSPEPLARGTWKSQYILINAVCRLLS